MLRRDFHPLYAQVQHFQFKYCVGFGFSYLKVHKAGQLRHLIRRDIRRRQVVIESQFRFRADLPFAAGEGKTQLRKVVGAVKAVPDAARRLTVLALRKHRLRLHGCGRFVQAVEEALEDLNLLRCAGQDELDHVFALAAHQVFLVHLIFRHLCRHADVGFAAEILFVGRAHLVGVVRHVLEPFDHLTGIVLRREVLFVRHLHVLDHHEDVCARLILRRLHVKEVDELKGRLFQQRLVLQIGHIRQRVVVGDAPTRIRQRRLEAREGICIGQAIPFPA